MPHKTQSPLSVFHYWMLAILLAVCIQHTYGQSKPERVFDEDFKERYSSDKFNYEGKEVIRHTRSGSGKYEDFENKNTEIKEEDNENEMSGDVQGFGLLNYLFILALIVAVFYLVYILINEGGSGIFSTAKNTTIATHEEITVQNIDEANFEALIAAAEKEENYRLAIRYYHLWVLRTLNQKNFIKLEEDKTNEEYLYEVKQQLFHPDFKFTCYLYDYVWYGEFPLNQRQYQKAKGNFVELIKKVS